MKTFILALLLLASSSAFADEWSSTDTKREALYQTLAVIDWIQTVQSTDYTEQNTFLGKHPSIAKINTYFAVTGIAHYFVAKWLPEEYRIPFQYISIGVEVGATVHNYSIGIKAHF